MNTQTLDWSDVPYILAVCEAGSLSAASRKLGVNHSTVFRRVEAVEARLGVRLFERLSHGYVMTRPGEHFYQKALALREGMNSIQLELGGKDLRLEGELSVTTTDSLLYCLTPILMRFQDEHPDVVLRLLSDPRALDLSQRDADIALRPTTKPPEHWVGRKLVPIATAAYAHRDHWDSIKRLPVKSWRWIMLDDDLRQSPMSQFAVAHKAPEAPVTIVNTVMGVFEMVRQGLGVAALPCYLGENQPELVRVHDPDRHHAGDLWVLSHPDIRRSARVHAFFAFAAATITDEVLGMPLDLNSA